MAGQIEGKVAVITGAGSGMGAAMVERFVQEGALVIAADISGNQNAVAEKAGKNCIPIQVDVAQGADIRRMLDLAISKFGKLDILCNNSGIAGDLAKTGEYTEEEFDRVWSINGRGPFLGMRYGIPLMLKNGGGSIVNTVSIASMVAFASMPAYCASKGAVLMLTKTAAVEYAAQNIRVNAICPGTVTTGLSMGMSKEYIAEVVKGIPLGRFGHSYEIANTALFLASDQSSFITGTSITADGGYTAI